MTIEWLHQQLGHNNTKDVGNLEQLVDEIEIDKGHSTSDVSALCATQNAKRAKVKKSWSTRAKDKLMIVHADALGPLMRENHLFILKGFNTPSSECGKQSSDH